MRQGKADKLAPRLVDSDIQEEVPDHDMSDDVLRLHEEQKTEDEKSPIIYWEMDESGKTTSDFTGKSDDKNTVDKNVLFRDAIPINSPGQSASSVNLQQQKQTFSKDSTTNPSSAAAGGYLARPSNIYAESKAGVFTSKPSAEKPVPPPADKQQGEELPDMKLVERNDIPAADEPLAHQTPPPLSQPVEDPALQDEAGEQKRRAAERLQKLRNLSFNVNAADPNNEFE
ncbi:MAG: hypothetical protein HC867_06300, partial [Bacteroidia bacterium]|nr:hypothetical protein [Bacteroidia bacterium]